MIASGQEDRITDSDYTIVFRVGLGAEGKSIHFRPIKKIKYHKPLEEAKREMVKYLPIRVTSEMREIESFVLSMYPNTMFIQHNYMYFGPYKIEYETQDQAVQGYVFSNEDLHEEGTSILTRGNIILLESSPIIWRDLGRRKIVNSNLKLIGTHVYKD